MSILMEPVSPNFNLSMQGIDTSEATTFRDILLAILDNRTRHPGNPNGKTWADRQSPSIALPLGSAISQHVQLTVEEQEQIRTESINGLTTYKLEQAKAQRRRENADRHDADPTVKKEDNTPIEIIISPKEIGDWMSIRVATVLQKKIETFTKELIGEKKLIGFYDEEKLEEHIRGLVFQDSSFQTLPLQEEEVG